MLTSMTGFGRASAHSALGQFIVEMQSINRKYLDVGVVSPKEFSYLEQQIRQWISEQLTRGQITVRLYFVPNIALSDNLLPDIALLRQLKKGWDHIAQQLGYDPKMVDLSFLMLHYPVQPKLDPAKEEDIACIKDCVQQALNALLAMKQKEGAQLTVDLDKRLHLLQQYVQDIEKSSPNATARMREKLLEKMQAVMAMTPEFEEKILREVALYAEKVDITEEITRLRSHFRQCSHILHAQEAGVGRKLEFLLQEMGREINTIGSKSMDTTISHLVVEMKSELEKMREQVQNIE